jgi:hypothetical protein
MRVSVEMFLNTVIGLIIPNSATEYRIKVGSQSTEPASQNIVSWYSAHVLSINNITL